MSFRLSLDFDFVLNGIFKSSIFERLASLANFVEIDLIFLSSSISYCYFVFELSLVTGFYDFYC